MHICLQPLICPAVSLNRVNKYDKFYYLTHSPPPISLNPHNTRYIKLGGQRVEQILFLHKLRLIRFSYSSEVKSFKVKKLYHKKRN